MSIKHDLLHTDVEIAFVEQVEDVLVLSSSFFPSKVGGKPAWLSLTGQPENINCKNCKNPMIFLLQVYVPSDDVTSSNYHRTIFIFCCQNGKCYQLRNDNNSFAVFRCGLPRENIFYPPNDVSHEKVGESHKENLKMENTWTKLCKVCGCPGSKVCGKCHKVQYCSKQHQSFDWKSGHKKMCGSECKDEIVSCRNVPSLLFPEYELVSEPENELVNELENIDELERNCEELSLSNENMYVMEEYSGLDKDWKSLEKESRKINDVVEDKTYLEFMERIHIQPEQVLRYERHGTPLWVSNLNKPNESDIPNCVCGAKRTFEFQVLPQLLNHLKVDSLEASIDWGTLAVYTCSEDCSQDDIAYHEEFLWKQDFCNTGIPAEILSKIKS